eukprot:gnl/TRDRNA2_/TRDRNA2_169097_c0_seq1.p1 gnl/TRDRNA2_/TRDRNA2_169097_c0~~gnl/TRDRNA2_/TRDRNA2_169097_c0_seq1.p1  ORF type:complete len:301 (+),score=61.88 gnl/TRDRNA2_/TRDRNA2_169097_c0_seq1:3-905(+)
MITYIFGICLVQFSTTYLLEDNTDPLAVEFVHEYWGSVFKAMLSLYWASTGGESWRYLAEPLRSVGSHAHFLFLVYIAFFMFVIMNTLTSLFVEAALENSDHDHAKQIREEISKKKKYMSDLRKLYHLVDADGDGELTLREFQKGCTDAELEAFANSLDIETTDLEEVFFLLSNQGRQPVDMEAFVMGCIKLRGPARSTDLNFLLHEHSKFQKITAHVLDVHTAKLEHILQVLPKQFTPLRERAPAPPQTSTSVTPEMSVPVPQAQQVDLSVLAGCISAVHDVAQQDELMLLDEEVPADK